MGIKQYFIDLMESFLTGIPAPLNECVDFSHGNDSLNYFGEDEDDDNHTSDYIICKIRTSENSTSHSKKLIIKFFTDFNAGSEMLYYITMDRNDIKLNDDSELSTTLISKDAVFNFSLKYDVPLSYEDLLEIHKKYISIHEFTKIDRFIILYTAGEEKKYGYG